MNMAQTVNFLYAKSEGPMLFSKGGVPAKLDKLLVDYREALKGGWTCKACGDVKAKAGGAIQAKSPPGWEDSVKRMKKHKEIDNPWALAWWMEEQGYSPGGGKKK